VKKNFASLQQKKIFFCLFITIYYFENVCILDYYAGVIKIKILTRFLIFSLYLLFKRTITPVILRFVEPFDVLFCEC
jgi:hypothetical protein